MLRFIFLGTSSGVPTLSRNVSGLAIKSILSKQWILVDAGEGTQHRLQHTNLSLHDLGVICITHAHGDHCYGLPGLLASAGMNKRQAPLLLIAPKQVHDWVRATITLTDLHLSYDIQYIENSHITAPLEILLGVTVQSHPLHHRVASHAFSIVAQHTQRKLNAERLKTLGIPRGALWGQLQQGQDIIFNGQPIYSNDVVMLSTQQVCAVIAGDNDQPELLADICCQADVLIHEATYTQATLNKVGSSPMHSSAQMTAGFAQTVHVPNLILTHFSPRYHHTDGLQPLWDEARSHYQGTLFLASDLDEYVLTPDAQLTLDQAGTLDSV